MLTPADFELASMKKARQKGITMIEVLVTVFITAVGLLGIAAMQSAATKSSLDSTQRSAAANIAYDIASRIRANTAASLDGSYTQAFNNAGLCNAPPVPMCSDHYDQQAGGVNAVAACNSTEVANFDAWEISCGYQNADDTFSSPINYLSNANVNIDVTCTDSDGDDANPCSINSEYRILLTWDGTANQRAVCEETDQTEQCVVMRTSI